MKIEEARKYHKIDAVIVGAGLAGLPIGGVIGEIGILIGNHDQVLPGIRPEGLPGKTGQHDQQGEDNAGAANLHRKRHEKPDQEPCRLFSLPVNRIPGGKRFHIRM